jgi:hypothetical protein
MGDLKPVSDSVSFITRENFSRKFVSLARILTQWTDIMGPELAAKTQPVKLHYRKPKSARDKPDAVLDIAVSSADATVLHYRKDLILARINQLFGSQWVTSLRFLHISAPAADRNASQVRQSIPRERLAALESDLEPVADPELKKRLVSLGRGVLRKSGF